MADIIDFKIYGDDIQVVEIVLESGEGVRAEIGTMLYMDTGIQMKTNTGGGMLKGLRRMVTGEKFFITTYTNHVETNQRIAFAAPYPGKVIPLPLDKMGGRFFCQKDAYLCSAVGVDVKIAFTKKIGVGLFGGEGFILQELSGDGLAFVHAGGTILEKDLGVGEVLKVDTGCITAFAHTVDYDIKFVGGVRNALFGGEGLFLTTLTGPGKVYLQSLPFARIADRVIAAARWRDGE